MNKQEIKKVIQKLKTDSKKRNFSQTVDLIVTLKDLNLKKPEDQVEFFATLHHKVGKKIKVCGIVGPELADEAKNVFDFVVEANQLDSYIKDKKKAKKLAKSYDYFVAQASIMPKIAAAFGRTLGPQGKMPNPKAGCIIAAKPQIKPLYEKLQKTIKVSAKKVPMFQLIIGKEDMNEEEIVDNIDFAVDQIIHHLPKERNNIKSIFLKLTMSKPVSIKG